MLPVRLHGLCVGAEGSFAGLTANVPEAGKEKALDLRQQTEGQILLYGKLLLLLGRTNFYFLNNRRVRMRVSIPLGSEATSLGTPSYFHGSSHMHWALRLLLSGTVRTCPRFSGKT